jgi:hypothetical protein
MKAWTEMDLDGKVSTVWAVAGIAFLVLAGYSTIRSLQMHRKIEKRLHLDGDGE